MTAARSRRLTAHEGTPAEQHHVQEAADESELTELDHIQKTARSRRRTIYKNTLAERHHK